MGRLYKIKIPDVVIGENFYQAEIWDMARLISYKKQEGSLLFSNPDNDDVVYEIADYNISDNISEALNLRISFGEILQEEFIIPAKLTPKKLANKTEIELVKIEAFLKNEWRVDNETARRLGKYFKTSTQFWLNLMPLVLSKNDTIEGF